MKEKIREWQKRQELDKKFKNNKIKYIVIKVNDMLYSLDLDEIRLLDKILDKIKKYRSRYGKKSNKYWVVNQDERYANKVKRMIQRSEKIKL